MAIRSIVIEPGQTIVLPREAVITSVILDGEISVTSSCGDLPEPTDYVCGAFFIWVDCDANDGHSMDEESTYYTSLTVGDTTYMINELIVTGEDCGTVVPVSTLNLHITDPALFQFTSVEQANSTKKTGVTLHFRVPDALFDTVELIIDNGGSAMKAIPFQEECE